MFKRLRRACSNFIRYAPIAIERAAHRAIGAAAVAAVTLGFIRQAGILALAPWIVGGAALLAMAWPDFRDLALVL